MVEVRGPAETVTKFLQDQPELARSMPGPASGDLTTFEIKTKDGKDLREELARRPGRAGLGDPQARPAPACSLDAPVHRGGACGDAKPTRRAGGVTNKTEAPDRQVGGDGTRTPTHSHEHRARRNTNTNPPDTRPASASADRVVPAPPRAVETAPSAMLTEGPTFARFLGFVGLFFLVLGRGGDHLDAPLGPRVGARGLRATCSPALGLALMLYHAVTDGEQEVRRMYGGCAAAWLLVRARRRRSCPARSRTGAEQDGRLLPAARGASGAGFLSLLFAIPFTRHETDAALPQHRRDGLARGGRRSGGRERVAGIFKPGLPRRAGARAGAARAGVPLRLPGTDRYLRGHRLLGRVCARGVWRAVLVYAIGRSTFPTLLYDGPAALRKPNGCARLVAGRRSAFWRAWRSWCRLSSPWRVGLRRGSRGRWRSSDWRARGWWSCHCSTARSTARRSRSWCRAGSS